MNALLRLFVRLDSLLPRCGLGFERREILLHFFKARVDALLIFRPAGLSCSPCRFNTLFNRLILNASFSAAPSECYGCWIFRSHGDSFITSVYGLMRSGSHSVTSYSTEAKEYRGQGLDRLTALVERLAERTEAVTHSVELLASMQIEAENRVKRLEDKVATMADGMALLTRVVLDHEQRIGNLEGNRPQR